MDKMQWQYIQKQFRSRQPPDRSSSGSSNSEDESEDHRHSCRCDGIQRHIKKSKSEDGLSSDEDRPPQEKQLTKKLQVDQHMAYPFSV